MGRWYQAFFEEEEEISGSTYCFEKERYSRVVFFFLKGSFCVFEIFSYILPQDAFSGIHFVLYKWNGAFKLFCCIIRIVVFYRNLAGYKAPPFRAQEMKKLLHMKLRSYSISVHENEKLFVFGTEMKYNFHFMC